eukprot:2833750-Rhodomonas_salina.2
MPTGPGGIGKPGGAANRACAAPLSCCCPKTRRSSRSRSFPISTIRLFDIAYADVAGAANAGFGGYDRVPQNCSAAALCALQLCPFFGWTRRPESASEQSMRGAAGLTGQLVLEPSTLSAALNMFCGRTRPFLTGLVSQKGMVVRADT